MFPLLCVSPKMCIDIVIKFGGRWKILKTIHFVHAEPVFCFLQGLTVREERRGVQNLRPLNCEIK